MENVAEPQDVANNKVMAILAYFGILFLVPMLAAKDSKFARFHANQGLVLFLTEIAVYVIIFVLTIIAAGTSTTFLKIVGILSLIFWICIFVLFILGIVNAATGKMKELPIIGKFRILK